MNMPQSMPLAIMKVILGYFFATGKDFAACVLHLQAAPLGPSPTLTKASMTEPTFTGYASQTAIAFGTPFNQPGEQGARSVAPTVPFICSGGTPSDTIYGWYLCDTTDTNLLLYVPFVAGTEVPINAPGDGVIVDCELWFSGG